MRKCALRRWASISLLLASAAAFAQTPDAPVGVEASDGFGFGARWRVQFERDVGPYKAGQSLDCRVEEPPDDKRPRAIVVCRLPGGGSVPLAEPDGRPGVLPVDILVRTLRLMLSQETR